MRQRNLVLVVLVCCSIALLTGTVTAQNETVNETVDEEPVDPGYLWIDNNTAIVDERLSDDGEAVLTLYSETNQRLIFTDAFGAIESGPVSEERRTLREGQESVVRVPVTVHRGDAGVFISTRDTLYGHPIERSRSALGPHHSAQVWVSGGIGAIAGVLVLAKLLDYLSNRLLRRRDL